MSTVWEWLEDFAKGFGLIIGTIGAALAFAQKWWMPYFRRWHSRRKLVKSLPEAMAATTATLGRIESTLNQTADTGSLLLGMIRHQADSCQDATFETDAAGLYLWVNAIFLRWTGQLPADLLGWGWINTIAHGERDRVRSEWEDAMAERRTFTSNFHLLDGQGFPIPVSVKATPLRQRDGEVVKWMGVITRLSAPIATR